MDCCFTPSDGYAVGSSEDGKVFYWEVVSHDYFFYERPQLAQPSPAQP